MQTRGNISHRPEFIAGIAKEVPAVHADSRWFVLCLIFTKIQRGERWGENLTLDVDLKSMPDRKTLVRLCIFLQWLPWCWGG